MQQNSINNLLKSEGILLAIIPFIGTLIGFVFEAGYVSYYDIPLSIIRMDFNRIITSTTLVSLFFITWFIGLHFAFSLSASTNAIVRALFIPTVKYLIFTPFFYAIPEIPHRWIMLGTFFVLEVLLYLLPPVFHRKAGATYMKKLSEYTVEIDTIEGIKGKREAKIYDSFFLILIASVLIFGIGRNTANNKEYYWILERFPNMFVVGFYGDTAILKEYEDSSKVIKEKMILIDIKSEKGNVYTNVKTGMLTRAPK